jgi:hypothetical protein
MKIGEESKVTVSTASGQACEHCRGYAAFEIRVPESAGHPERIAHLCEAGARTLLAVLKKTN